MGSFIITLDARAATDHFPGIGRYVSNLAQALAEQLAADERLLLIYDPSQPSRWRLPAPTANVSLVEAAISPFSLRQQWLIPRLLRRRQAHIYHSPYYLMPYWPGVPTVLTIYDFIPQRYPSHVSLQARLLFRLATTLALRRAGHVITISEATRQDLLDTYAVLPDKVTAVPLAPDPHFRPQAPAAIEQIRRRYRLPHEYVLYLGINKPHKNLLRLLQAWRLVLNEQPAPACLVIAGAWDARYPEPEQRAAELGLADHVRFLGPVAEEDLPALYAGATVFVFASLYEGYGLPVVEAMACGTAVVCSGTTSLPEVGGEAALYFDPLQPADIAGAIGRVLADGGLRVERRRLGLAQAAQFSWTRTAAATLEIYRRLI